MDPVSLILGALAAGAGAALKDTAGQAVKDAYAGLKSLIIKKWGNKTNETEAQTILDSHAEDPEAGAPLVASRMRKLGLDQDVDILRLAEALQKLVDPAGSAQGKYQVTISHSKGVQVGDHNTQYNKFD